MKFATLFFLFFCSGLIIGGYIGSRGVKQVCCKCCCCDICTCEGKCCDDGPPRRK